MFGLLAGLSVWIATVASPSQVAGAAPAAMIQSGISTVTTRINSRMVRVQVGTIRSPFPPIGFIPGSQFLGVRISTSDPRGLPTITSLRATVINQQHQTWASTPQPSPTLVFDPKAKSYFAGNGPPWSVGSQETVRLEIRTGTHTTTVNIPARLGVIAS
jgi:hypothetical protein